eukprot:TRINITY_DN1236_c0_g1_i1.p2 TRINITY_DN1236_c0_g1~~TRINITY_DN1236_c0_g1_i1.p2  ORF type:complete len:829 (-),score=78.47 TRINITY_DN1236_c0_g1_i1:2446-4932(-)
MQFCYQSLLQYMVCFGQHRNNKANQSVNKITIISNMLDFSRLYKHADIVIYLTVYLCPILPGSEALSSILTFHLFASVLVDVLQLQDQPRSLSIQNFLRLLKDYKLMVLLVETCIYLALPLPLPLSQLSSIILLPLISITACNGKTKKEPAKVSKDEGTKLLELTGQGYFLCRRVEDLDSPNGFSVVFTNRKAKDILKETECSLEELFEELYTLGDCPRSLRDVGVETFQAKIGTCVKVFLEIKKRQNNFTGRGTADSFNADATYKMVPFKYFKAALSRVSQNDVLVILTERNAANNQRGDNELNTAIACTLTHELRTVTNGIIGNMQLLGDDATVSEIHHEIALSSGYLLVDRLNDLFDYMQIKNNGFKSHYTEFALEEVLQHLTLVVKPLAKEKQVKFEVEKVGKVPVTIVGDKARIQQVLVNITSKALEFTDYGKVALKVKQKKEKRITFVVVSTGGSMHAKLERILKEFSPVSKKEQFIKAKNVAEESTENLEALSLQISQLICKELGTSITAKSVKESHTQLKFHIRDGFPETQPQIIDNFRLLRKCSTNLHERKTTPIIPVHNYKPPLSKFSLDPQDITMIKSSSNNLAYNAPDPEELTFVDEIPEESSIETIPVSTFPSKRATDSPRAYFTDTNEKPLNLFAEKAGLESPAANRPRRTTTTITSFLCPIPKHKTVDDGSVCSVLIADDNTINRFVLKSLLKKYGYSSIEAQDGKEAADLVDRYIKAGKLHELKLIFMDLQMPAMNGIQATTLIRKMCSEKECKPPVLIGISSDPVEQDRLRFVRAGLNEFMNKPVDSTKILYVIKKYIKQDILLIRHYMCQ